jgi:hypothetical protein
LEFAAVACCLYIHVHQRADSLLYLANAVCVLPSLAAGAKKPAAKKTAAPKKKTAAPKKKAAAIPAVPAEAKKGKYLCLLLLLLLLALVHAVVQYAVSTAHSVALLSLILYALAVVTASLRC